MLRLVVGSLFVAATAYAQAPGQDTGQMVGEGYGAPGMAAPVQTDGGCGGGAGWHRNVMADRWAVGLSVGTLGLGPKNAPSGDQSQFQFGQLSLRFRASLHLELEAAFGGGREDLGHGMQGDSEVQTGALGLRYRFAPNADWNWWLMGAIGSISVASHEATDQDRKDAERPLGELGIGIERRFHKFALQAELRAIGVGQAQNTDAPVAATVGPNGGNGGAPMPPAATSSIDNYSGGSLTIGASYYF